MPRPLQSILNCFRPTPPAEERASTSTGQPADSASHPPRRAPVTLQGLANFDAQRIRQRQVEIQALVPDTRKALSDGESQLGGYVHARQVDGRPVEGPALERLKRGNETVMETRQALAHGRGNVTADINDSNGQSTIRTAAGRRIGRKYLPGTCIRKKGPLFKYPADIRAAAGAMAAQAGNCGDHANVAAFLHAAKLEDGERVHAVSSKTVDHVWAELHGETSDRTHDIVMDAWGKGPAIFAEDGVFSADEQGTAIEHHYDKASGAEAHAAMCRLQVEHEPRIQEHLQRQMKKLGPDFRFPDNAICDATAVICAEFAERVPRKMSRPVDPAKLAPPLASEAQQSTEPVQMGELWMAPLRQQIHATETARALGASGVREVTQAAERIAHVAADLRRYPLESHPAQTAPEDV